MLIVRNKRLYDDRPRHVTSFRKFASNLKTRMMQKRPDIPLEVVVVQVPPGTVSGIFLVRLMTRLHLIR